MSAARFSAPAAPGSLLKGAAPARKRKTDMGRAPRQRDEKHLAAIRACPCVVCFIIPCGEASHVRMTRQGKPIAGIGNKPDDLWVLPLCPDHHREQHKVGEREFWEAFDIDPIRLAAKLHEQSPDIEAMKLVCYAAGLTIGELGK
jgi:hypothetical protein